jgi:radical SAM superfamily enzyme YgiQ (UPF0313 family)
MRVVLIYPPAVVADQALTGTNRPVVFLPLGIMYIAASLREQGHEVTIIDARLSATISAFKNGQSLFGDPLELIIDRIASLQPDVVGISNNFYLDVPVVESLASEIKRRLNKVSVVVGGHTATAIASEYALNKDIDFIIKGEGEHKFPLVLNRISAETTISQIEDKIIDGSVDNTPYFISDLDSLPFPAYDLVDMERYFELQTKGHSPRTREYGHRSVTLFTSRGCPWDCGFCSIHGVMGYKFRSNSANYVLEHIRYLIEHYKIDYIHFEDDNFTLWKGRFESILDGLIDMKCPIKWDTPNGVRADMLTEQLVRKARRAGCKYIVIAVESGVDRVLNERIGKKLDLEAVRKTSAWCKLANLEAQAFYILGYPGETIAEMETTIDFALDLYRQYNVYPNISILLPLYGTRVRKECVDQGLLVQRESGERVSTPEFSPEDVDRILISARKSILKIFVTKILTHPWQAIEYASVVIRNPRILRKFFPFLFRDRVMPTT